MRKFVVLTLVLTLLMSVSSLAFAQDTVTLRVATYYTLQDRASGYPDVVELFEKENPGIKIELTTGSQSYNAALRPQFAAGDPPDIVGIQHTRFLDYVRRDLLEDITGFYNEAGFNKSLYGLSTGWVQFDDRIWGIADNPGTIEWFYNKDMFDDLGLAEPENLTELIEVSQAIRDAGFFAIGWGALDYWTNTAFLGMITAQTMGLDAINSSYDSGEWQIEELKEALEVIKTLVDAGAVDSVQTGIDYNGAISMFVNGQIGIMPTGGWTTSTFEATKSDDFNYGVFKNPVIFADEPLSPWSASGGQILSISSASKHKEEAKKFLEFLFSHETQMIVSEKGSLLSSLDSVNRVLSTDVVTQDILMHMEDTNEHSGMLIDYLPIAVMDSLGVSIQSMINGALTPEQVLQEIEAAANR